LIVTRHQRVLIDLLRDEVRAPGKITVLHQSVVFARTFRQGFDFLEKCYNFLPHHASP
jgi:hypothetical protein